MGAPILVVNGHSDMPDDYPSDVTKSAFGERVRGLRVALGLTQVALAQKARINQSTLSDIESGVSQPHKVRAETLRNLAKALETNPNFLVTGADTPVAPQILTIEEAELVALYRELTKVGRGSALLGAARGMLETATDKPMKARPYPKVKAS